MDGFEEKSKGKTVAVMTVAIIVLAIVCLVLIGLQFFQKGIVKNSGEQSYEKFTGVANDSFEYRNYKSCINNCAKCETNCKDSMLRDAAMGKSDESFCSQISEEWAKTSCTNSIYNAKAIANKDKSYCEKISENFTRMDCMSAVAIELAISQGNIALCDQSPEGRADSCRESWRYRTAIKNLDESLCSQLANAMSQEMCRNEVNMMKQMQTPSEPAAPSAGP
jgi:hypothetical protein